MVDMIAIIDATGDLRPVHWLIEKYIQDPDATRTAAIGELAKLMPIVQALLEQSSDGGKIKAVK